MILKLITNKDIINFLYVFGDKFASNITNFRINVKKSISLKLFLDRISYSKFLIVFSNIE